MSKLVATLMIPRISDHRRLPRFLLLARRATRRVGDYYAPPMLREANEGRASPGRRRARNRF